MSDPLPPDATLSVAPSKLAEIDALRERYRREMDCQVIHDSIHDRPGWTIEYLISADGTACGYGSVAVSGPWKDRPTFYEFYLLPQLRQRAFECFERFLAASEARHFEVQSNDQQSTVMAITYGENIATESILFEDGRSTALPAGGTTLRQSTPHHEIHAAMERRQGGGEWVLELDGAEAGKGGILFHYNQPYGDIYMEVSEPRRRRARMAARAPPPATSASSALEGSGTASETVM